MSIFVRQLGAVTCEVKFDRHCNWIVTVIAWNVPFPPASLILDAHSCRENKGFGYYTTSGSLRQQDCKLGFFFFFLQWSVFLSLLESLLCQWIMGEVPPWSCIASDYGMQLRLGFS